MSRDAEQIPPVPAGFDPEALFEGVYWHQRWEVFRGVTTPGGNSIAELCRYLRLPRDLSGQRVLDVGAWNGCLSFECERRGAREVIALGPEDPAQTGFLRLRHVLNATRTHYHRGSVYSLRPEELGRFDIVLFCGVLYHLRYPLLGLDSLRRVCTGTLYVETHLLDHEFLVKKRGRLKPVGLAEVAPVLAGIPLWRFYRTDELNGDESNWFGPNAAAVVAALESAGFAAEPPRLWGVRGVFRANVKPGPPEFLALRSGEGVYYDVVARDLFRAAREDF
jgi:tRNA (mo5U34)-methyltransferase